MSFLLSSLPARVRNREAPAPVTFVSACIVVMASVTRSSTLPSSTTSVQIVLFTHTLRSTENASAVTPPFEALARATASTAVDSPASCSSRAKSNAFDIGSDRSSLVTTLRSKPMLALNTAVWSTCVPRTPTAAVATPASYMMRLWASVRKHSVAASPSVVAKSSVSSGVARIAAATASTKGLGTSLRFSADHTASCQHTDSCTVATAHTPYRAWISTCAWRYRRLS